MASSIPRRKTRFDAARDRGRPFAVRFFAVAETVCNPALCIAGLVAASSPAGAPDWTPSGDDAGAGRRAESGNEAAAATSAGCRSGNGVVSDGVEEVALDPGWPYAGNSAIHSGRARLYRAPENRKNATVGVNAGHGTEGGQSVKTYCHPDKTPKVTGGTTAAGSVMAVAVSGGMSFSDGTPEAQVTLDAARLLRDKLLARGYDVLMLRDGADVQLDNVARTVIANNVADCLVSLHWDGDGLGYDKGCFFVSTPGGIKDMEPVSRHWRDHERLGSALVGGLRKKGCKIFGNGKTAVDLTQTCYSTIPSVDIELGNQASAHDEAALSALAEGLLDGIEAFFADGLAENAKDAVPGPDAGACEPCPDAEAAWSGATR